MFLNVYNNVIIGTNIIVFIDIYSSIVIELIQKLVYDGQNSTTGTNCPKIIS